LIVEECTRQTPIFEHIIRAIRLRRSKHKLHYSYEKQNY
jgi:hypothetical protein